MKVITNKGRRRLGVPGRRALILDPNQAVPVSESQLDEIGKNRTAARWLASGVLVVTDDGEVVETPKPQPKTMRVKEDRDKREELVLPEGLTGEGIEQHSNGGGWWDVYVNGFKVTDRKVRQDEATAIAAEYE